MEYKYLIVKQREDNLKILEKCRIKMSAKQIKRRTKNVYKLSPDKILLYKLDEK